MKARDRPGVRQTSFLPHRHRFWAVSSQGRRSQVLSGASFWGH